MSSRSVTSCSGWCSVQWWHLLRSRLWSRLWSRLSATGGRRYTCPCTSPACLRIHCSPIVARKASGCIVLTRHSRVSFHNCVHHVMGRKLNTSLLLFSDVGSRFLDQELHFLYYGARKPALGLCAHIHG